MVNTRSKKPLKKTNNPPPQLKTPRLNWTKTPSKILKLSSRVGAFRWILKRRRLGKPDLVGLALTRNSNMLKKEESESDIEDDENNNLFDKCLII